MFHILPSFELTKSSTSHLRPHVLLTCIARLSWNWGAVRTQQRILGVLGIDGISPAVKCRSKKNQEIRMDDRMTAVMKLGFGFILRLLLCDERVFICRGQKANWMGLAIFRFGVFVNVTEKVRLYLLRLTVKTKYEYYNVIIVHVFSNRVQYQFFSLYST